MARRSRVLFSCLAVLGDTGVETAAAARHALNYLDVLAGLVLTLEAEVHPAVIATVGPLAGIGERVARAGGWVGGGARVCARIGGGHEVYPFVVRVREVAASPDRFYTLGAV